MPEKSKYYITLFLKEKQIRTPFYANHIHCVLYGLGVSSRIGCSLRALLLTFKGSVITKKTWCEVDDVVKYPLKYLYLGGYRFSNISSEIISNCHLKTEISRWNENEQSENIFSLITHWNKLNLTQIAFHTYILILIKYEFIYRLLIIVLSVYWLEVSKFVILNLFCTFESVLKLSFVGPDGNWCISVGKKRKKRWCAMMCKVSSFWSPRMSAQTPASAFLFIFRYETMSNCSQNCWIDWISTVQCFNQFTSGILLVFPVPRTGLFSMKNQKNFLAINIFFLSMKRSPDTQINAFSIDIYRIKLLVFSLWQAPTQRPIIDQCPVEQTAFQREIKDLVIMDINPYLQMWPALS